MCGLHICFAEIWHLLGCGAGLLGVLPTALKEHSAFIFAGWEDQKNAICHNLAVALSRALTICHLLSSLLTSWCPALSQQILLWHSRCSSRWLAITSQLAAAGPTDLHMTISHVWNYFLNPQPLKVKAFHPIEMLNNTILVIHCHIPEDLNSHSVGNSTLWVISVRSRP